MENETGVGRDRSRSCWICCWLCFDPRFHWAIECIFSLTILLFDSRNSRIFFHSPTSKMKSAPVSNTIAPDLWSHSAGGWGGGFQKYFWKWFFKIGGEWTRSWFCWIYCCPRFRWAIRFNNKRSRISNNGWTKFRLKRPTESRFLKSSSVKTRLLQDHYDCSFLHDTSTNRYNFSVPVRQI